MARSRDEWRARSGSGYPARLTPKQYAFIVLHTREDERLAHEQREHQDRMEWARVATLLKAPPEVVHGIMTGQPMRQQRRNPNDERAFLVSGNMWWTEVPALPDFLKHGLSSPAR